jgi:alkylation response protein AidB-like acyl-CoA dehydrogenase
VGTFGVSAESPFDEWYRDVRMFAFPDGTSQIQQLLIGRELTGLSAF